MESTNIITITAGLIIFGLLFRITGSKNADPLNALPGPPRLPLIGNAHQLGARPHRKLQEWDQEYGHVYRVKLGYDNWVFLGDPDAVKEVIEKQSGSSSGRAPMPVASDVMSGSNRLLFLTYGQKWRKLRTIVHKLLTPKASETYKPSQEFESKQLIYDIAISRHDETSFYKHVRRYTTSVVMTSTYGRRVHSWDSEDVREIYKIMDEFTKATTPGAFVADLFPPLARIPTWMQWWRHSAQKAYERQAKVWMSYWNGLQKQVEAGIAPECFVKQFMETDFQKQGISEIQAGFAAGSMLEAGSETTSSAMNSVILYMAANPKVQETAAAEISRVVGDDRSPIFDDEADLPYIRAIGKEVLRIRPVTTIGTPHYTTADVRYKDHIIPKDTVVAISQWALHFDPEKWSDPEAFDPSRYLAYPHKSGVYSGSGDVRGRDHFDFGGGRRICPGMHLAENSLFITVAKMLWAFKIDPPLDAVGNPETMDTSDEAYEPGMNTLPKPFRVRFVPRNDRRMEVLEREWEKAQREGYHLGDVKVDCNGMVTA